MCTLLETRYERWRAAVLSGSLVTGKQENHIQVGNEAECGLGAICREFQRHLHRKLKKLIMKSLSQRTESALLPPSWITPAPGVQRPVRKWSSPHIEIQKKRPSCSLMSLHACNTCILPTNQTKDPSVHEPPCKVSWTLW